jgi:AcrR family transcriptional regulator
MKDRTNSILSHVSRLYHRYGIKSVTMDDVARHLGISKKTLYEFFRDKKDLVSQVLESEHVQHCEIFNALELRKLNAIEELFEIYTLIKNLIHEYNPSMEYDIRKYYPELYSHIRSVRRKTLFENSLRNMIKGKKEGLYRKNLDAEVIAKLHLFRIENLYDSDLFTSEELNSFDTFHELFVYHLQGIMSEKGREFFEKNFSRFRGSME